jgi:tetratricopeptide (TPR) repeat protein
MGYSAESENQITLYGGSTTEISTPDSVLLKIGRLFASLRAPFTANTLFGTLGAKGTTFELEAAEKQATLLQLEGAVEFQPRMSRILPREDESMRGALMTVAFNSQSKAPKDSSQPGTLKDHEIVRLTSMTFGSGQKPATQPIDIQTCNALVQKNSEALVATRPKFPSRPVASSTDGKYGYESARTEVVCAAKGEALQTLAAAYSEWSQSADAVHALNKARDQGSLRSSDPGSLNDIGNAYRLAGDLDNATRFYESALKLDQRFAFPYNGLGDVSRDKALITYAHAKSSEMNGVRTLLEASKQYYQRSLSSQMWGKEGGPNRAIALYNVGDVDLLLTIVDPSNSAALLNEAESFFGQALREANFPFAEVGQARVQLTRAQLVRSREVAQGTRFWDAVGQSLAESNRVRQERRPFLDQASRQLKATLEKYPGFSVAAETLGEVFEEGGDRKSASRMFAQAIELDPHNAVAYLRYAGTIRNRDEARVYTQLSRLIEPAAGADISLGRLKISMPPPPASGEIIAPPPAEAPGGITSKPIGTLNVTQLVFRYSSPPDARTVVLANSGPGRLAVRSVTLQGNGSAFRIMSDGCSGRTIEVNQNCSLRVALVGTAGKGTGAVSTLVIVHDGANSPQTVQLSGENLIQ